MSNATAISPFLTEQVLAKAFKQITGCEVPVVESLEVSRASKPGEGLLSAVYRIRVRGVSMLASFVVKGIIKDKLLRLSLNSEKYFQRETLFYTKVLPIFVNVQTALGAKERIQESVPVCYAVHCDGENDFILMQDMSASGYHPVSKEVTVLQRNLSLRALAHFHAVSIALRVKAPKDFDDIAIQLTEIYYTERARDWYSTYLNMAIEFSKKVILDYEKPNSIYFLKFFDLLSNDVYGDLIKLTTSRSDHRAILHGDAWCPNFLCSKANAVAIDFQIVRCASPALDLSYFILICSEQCRDKNSFNEAVEVYYAGLKYYLEDMGLCPEEVFSRIQLDQELKSYGRFGILACLTSFLLLSNTDKFDTLTAVSSNDTEGIIPLEKLWKLKDYNGTKDKMKLVNAVRVAVDIGLI